MRACASRSRAEISALQRRLGTTTLYVTHDQTEAMTLGDRVAVQRDGLLHQCAPPMELFDAPINEFVASFIGSPAMNFLRGEGSAGVARFDTFDVPITSRQNAALTSSSVTIGVRPEAWTLGDPDDPGTQVEVIVESVEVLRPESYVTCLHAPTRTSIVVRTESGDRLRHGDRIGLRARPDAVHLFDGATGLRLPSD